MNFKEQWEKIKKAGISESKHSNDYGSKYDLENTTADVMSGMDKRVEPDWDCPKCGTNNPGSSIECKHCGRIRKAVVEKPGASIHSQKWDDCVKDVKAKGGANAYAVCTKQLGEESFKAMHTLTKAEMLQAIDEMKKAVGVEYAGEVPKSELAEQDLEGETRKMETQNQAFRATFRVINTLNRSEAFPSYVVNAKNLTDAHNKAAKLVLAEYPNYDVRNHDIKLQKGTIETTGKKLDSLAEKAEEAETEKQKSNIIARIGRVQVQRQNAVINARKNGSGDFKSFWRSNAHV